MADFDPRELAHLIEGTVEQDPMTDRYMVHAPGEAPVDLQELLARYKGQEVRLTLASLENLAKLAALVEGQGGGGQVLGIGPDLLNE